MIERWQKYFDTNGHDSTVLPDLSKGFDWTDHQLLVAKRDACGVEANSLFFLWSYFEWRRWKALTAVLMVFLVASHKFPY